MGKGTFFLLVVYVTGNFTPPFSQIMILQISFGRQSEVSVINMLTTLASIPLQNGRWLNTQVSRLLLRRKFVFLVKNSLLEKCEVYRPLPLFASVRHNSLIRIEPFFFYESLYSYAISSVSFRFIQLKSRTLFNLA